jgi:hypothetical protein
MNFPNTTERMGEYERIQCVRDVKRVVQALTRRSIEDCVAIEGGLLKVLDGTGSYRAAIAEGLLFTTRLRTLLSAFVPTSTRNSG